MATELDPFISALCDQAAQWLTVAAMSAQCLGLTLPQGIEAMRPRVHTGYQPAEVRREVAHRAYRDGLLTPPRRLTADDRAKAEARAWGLAS